MLPRVLKIITLLCISALLVASSPTPRPLAEPEPIDTTIANIIAINENLGCSGPTGCIAAQNSSAAADIFATSGVSRMRAMNGPTTCALVLVAAFVVL